MHTDMEPNAPMVTGLEAELVRAALDEWRESVDP